MKKYFTKKNLKNTFFAIFFVASVVLFSFVFSILSSNVIYKTFEENSSRIFFHLLPFSLLPLLFFIITYFVYNKNKKIIYFLLAVLLFNILFAFNTLSFSVDKFKGRLYFLVQEGRLMDSSENNLFDYYGDPYLKNKDYCDAINGMWFVPDPGTPLRTGTQVVMPDYFYHGHNTSPWCAPRTKDGGKMCYNDKECQSYCKVNSILSTFGKCYKYWIDDRSECDGDYNLHIINGRVEKGQFCWGDYS